jgi:hypothetical protein
MEGQIWLYSKTFPSFVDGLGYDVHLHSWLRGITKMVQDYWARCLVCRFQLRRFLLSCFVALTVLAGLPRRDIGKWRLTVFLSIEVAANRYLTLLKESCVLRPCILTREIRLCLSHLWTSRPDSLVPVVRFWLCCCELGHYLSILKTCFNEHYELPVA